MQTFKIQITQPQSYWPYRRRPHAWNFARICNQMFKRR